MGGFRWFPTGYRPYFILISDIALESEKIVFVHRASQKLHFNVLLKMPCFIHNNTGSSHSVLCGHLAPVVQKVDNTIHWIAQLVSLTLIRGIVIYPVDSTIQLLNNWGLTYNVYKGLAIVNVINDL